MARTPRATKLETPGEDKPIPPAPTPATAAPVTDPVADTVPQKLVDSTKPLTLEPMANLAKTVMAKPDETEADEDVPVVHLIPGNRFKNVQRMGAWVLTENGWIKE